MTDFKLTKQQHIAIFRTCKLKLMGILILQSVYEDHQAIKSNSTSNFLAISLASISITTFLCTLNAHWTMAAVKDMISIFVHKIARYSQEQLNTELELRGKPLNCHLVANYS